MSAPDELPEPDLSGRTLDRYRLLRRLGVGGMGAVYEAEHTRLRKHFAVKLLRYELATNELSRKRFLREARAASAVSHPHVVAISDFGESDEGHVFFAMELLEGQDLHDLLAAEHVLPWPRTQEILVQVTSALQAAHQQGIIHRDIKPSNVFLANVPGKGDHDFVKVLDFGIAKLSGNIGQATAKLTSTDEIFGTVAYMAPEMATGKNDDPRSDMYAVGVMMYRMLTGQLPYASGNAFQILTQHITAPIPSLRAMNLAIPEAVDAIVQRAMAKHPDQRFTTMEEFNRALRRGMLEGLPAEPRQWTEVVTPLPRVAVPPAHHEHDATHEPRRSVLGWLLSVVGAAVLGIVGFSMVSGRGHEAVTMGELPVSPSATSDSNGSKVEPPIESEPEPKPALPRPAEPSTNDGAASPAKPEPLAQSEATKSTKPKSTKPKSTKPKPTKSKSDKPKPKSDKEVVAALAAKIGTKCKDQLSGKVKVEGMINPAGKVEGLLVTPPQGLGPCKKLVTAAKFDPQGGVRPMPRFSVEP